MTVAELGRIGRLVRDVHDALASRVPLSEAARLYADGLARHWGPAADYVADHSDVLAQGLVH